MIQQQLIRDLARIVGKEDVLASRRDLLVYGYDSTSGECSPEVVVFPADASEVSAVLRLASREGVPVVARGAGTNLSGGTLAVKGGIVLGLSRMNRIVETDTASERAVIQPGVVNLELQNSLAPLGYLYAPDPASQKVSTLGGNIGENAGGPHCLKYGVTTNHVYGLQVVLPNGQVIHTGGTMEDNPGYDLTGLLVGSEGTLGIVTSATLRLMRAPEATKTMLAVFETLEDSGNAVSEIIAEGIVPATLEIMDRTVVAAVEASTRAGYPLDAEAVLIVELDGLRDGQDRQADRIAKLCRGNRAREVRVAGSEAERSVLWAGRRGAFGAIARLSPSYSVQDGTVPRTRLAETLRGVMAIGEKHGLRVGNVAHAGDGNLHPLITFNPRDPEEVQRVHEAGREILELCVRMGGTLTGEHGIGLEKRASMPLLYGEGELEIMAAIKRAFDPEGLLNPGKVLPDEPAAGGSGLPAATVPVPTLPHPHEDPAPCTPRSEQEVVELARQSAAHRTPIVVVGGRTKQEVEPVQPREGILLSTAGLSATVEMDAENLTVTVGAGKVIDHLQRELAEVGLFLPLDPVDSARSTVGGTLATNSSGPNRLQYRTARDLVLGMRVVTPTGRAIRLGGKTVKDVAGYDLKKLYIGSWGTLGAITEATFRLLPVPEASATVAMLFGSLAEARGAMSALLASFLRPSSAELLSPGAMPESVEQALGLGPGEYLLMVAVEGAWEATERQKRELIELGTANAARDVAVFEWMEERRLWEQRKRVFTQLPPERPFLLVKASVPLRRLFDFVDGMEMSCRHQGLALATASHAGNGIVYAALSAEAGGEDGLTSAAEQAVRLAAGYGGFASPLRGSRQVIRKARLWPARSDYELMRRIKAELDPHNLWSPARTPGGTAVDWDREGSATDGAGGGRI